MRPLLARPVPLSMPHPYLKKEVQPYFMMMSWFVPRAAFADHQVFTSAHRDRVPFIPFTCGGLKVSRRGGGVLPLARVLISKRWCTECVGKVVVCGPG